MTAINEQIEYWKKSALNDFRIAKDMCKMKHYDACLFYCHLSVEKMIKGLVAAKTRETPPKIHDLIRLAAIADIKKLCSKEQLQELSIMTRFHIAGRYSGVKLDFYKIATKPRADKYLKISEDLNIWLKEKYQKQ
jgi:HEPN domain-containing protein